MEKFKEMRLRAFAFQELTGCQFRTGSTYFVELSNASKKFTFINRPNGHRFYYLELAIDTELTEHEWINKLESTFGQKLPTLVEAREMMKETEAQGEA